MFDPAFDQLSHSSASPEVLHATVVEVGAGGVFGVLARDGRMIDARASLPVACRVPNRATPWPFVRWMMAGTIAFSRCWTAPKDTRRILVSTAASGYWREDRSP